MNHQPAYRSSHSGRGTHPPQQSGSDRQFDHTFQLLLALRNQLPPYHVAAQESSGNCRNNHRSKIGRRVGPHPRGIKFRHFCCLGNDVPDGEVMM